MDSSKLYARLERDFINPELSDDWAKYMGKIEEFISPNFKKRSMGLVCDFAGSVNKVFTAVFPSNPVMQKILDSGIRDAMLFVHHPAIWDIRKAPNVFTQMDKELLSQFKERKISIYNLHVPLDNYGDYSTSVTVAKAIGVEPKKSFVPYFGALAGVIGKANVTTVKELQKKFEEAVGHKIGVYAYGDSKIKNQNVAVIAGGGNDIEMLRDIEAAGVNTFVTGISAKNTHSSAAHEFAQKNKINVLGGTHYSTERFACIAMVDYFKKLGLPSEFISDEPVLEDM